MAGPLLEALLELDTVARVGARTLGEHSHMGGQLLDAVARVRRLVAPAALHEAAARPPCTRRRPGPTPRPTWPASSPPPNNPD